MYGSVNRLFVTLEIIMHRLKPNMFDLFFSKLMQQSSSFVMEGVKNLVVKKHNLPVTKIVDELMEVNSK